MLFFRRFLKMLNIEKDSINNLGLDLEAEI